MKAITYDGQNAERVAEFVGSDSFQDRGIDGIEILVAPRWIRIFHGDVISKDVDTLPGQGIRVNRDTLSFS